MIVKNYLFGKKNKRTLEDYAKEYQVDLTQPKDQVAIEFAARIKYFFNDEFSELPKLLLDDGADAHTVFKYFEPWICTEKPVVMFRDLEILKDHGLKSEEIGGWLSRQLTDCSTPLYEALISNHRDELKSFGIDANKYLDKYLDFRCEFIVDDPRKLPNSVSINYFVNHVSMKRIVESEKGHFESFIEKFLDFGGHFHVLESKFLSDIGYPEGGKELLAMADMIWTKKTTLINRQKFVSLAVKADLNRDERDYLKDVVIFASSNGNVIAKIS